MERWQEGRKKRKKGKFHKIRKKNKCRILVGNQKSDNSNGP